METHVVLTNQAVRSHDGLTAFSALPDAPVLPVKHRPRALQVAHRALRRLHATRPVRQLTLVLGTAPRAVPPARPEASNARNRVPREPTPRRRWRALHVSWWTSDRTTRKTTGDGSRPNLALSQNCCIIRRSQRDRERSAAPSARRAQRHRAPTLHDASSSASEEPDGQYDHAVTGNARSTAFQNSTTMQGDVPSGARRTTPTSARTTLREEGPMTPGHHPGDGDRVRIRPARPSDRDGVYAVCLRTGDAGGDASRWWSTVTCWVTSGLGPTWRCARDWRSWPRPPPVSRATSSGPRRPLRSRWSVMRSGGRCCAPATPIRRMIALTPDHVLHRHVHHPPGPPPDVVVEYPAHLHVNLLPPLQGRGVGRRLLETLFDALVDVPGVHLGVAPRNARAAAFYLHNGFVPVGRPRGPDEGWLLGRQLAR